MFSFLLGVLFAAPDDAAVKNTKQFTPGDYEQSLQVGARTRKYRIHVPRTYRADAPTPVVLVFHGAGTDGGITIRFTGLNEKADAANFVAVYPDGTGRGTFLTWNAWGRRGEEGGRPNDVEFVAKLLDELEMRLNVDKRRVFAAGMSNGAMFCYTAAAGLSERFAAIAPVAGALTIDKVSLKRPVPAIHFHGTQDRFVPYDGLKRRTGGLALASVQESAAIWAKACGCPATPKEENIPNVKDGFVLRRTTYGPGGKGAEVVVYTIEKGGHTWPGRKAPVAILGAYTMGVSANDLMWAFFQKHPKPEQTPD